MQKEKEVKKTTACFSLLFTHIIYCNVSLKVGTKKQQMISSWFHSGSINHKFPPLAQLQSPSSCPGCGWGLSSPAASHRKDYLPQTYKLFWQGAGSPQSSIEEKSLTTILSALSSKVAYNCTAVFQS